jgi:hypothetical protein
MKRQVERQTVEIPVLVKLNQHPLFFAVKLRNTGSVKDGKYIKLPFGVVRGTPDILVHVGNEFFGTTFYIECKAPKGKQSTVQKIYEHKIKKYGTRYYVVDAASQIEEIIRKEEDLWNCLMRKLKTS